MDLSIFKCISCFKEYNIKEIRYRCDCGNLLEVIHDLESVIPNTRSYKDSLDSGMAEIAFIRYKSILFPSLPDSSIITLSEGNTPLYDVTHSFPQFNSIKLKHEGLNPTLSFKDRGMVSGVSWSDN